MRLFTRPCIPSGVTCWTIIMRNTAETTSAAPAATSSARAAGSQGTSPNAVIVRPQTTTQTATARPGRCTPLTRPVNSDPASAPRPGAALRYPTVAAPPPYRWVARAGNTARGRPNTIAPRSITKMPASGWLDRRYRSPPISEAKLAGCPPRSGGSAGSSSTLTRATPNEPRSSP